MRAGRTDNKGTKRVIHLYPRKVAKPSTVQGRQSSRSAGSAVYGRIRGRTGAAAQFNMDAEAKQSDSRSVKEDG
ncbi:hypothetical protein NDU88_002311 [Pleurodeles waltl]|uniref:Uncharacterized protein n=1 Tax=Pleurodeles waltl TaxID=8319 RepID=A0AAV7Q5M2_PLEWA|nr:hypothetical protein NDU88_002311 [Pleurodeles waltl]